MWKFNVEWSPYLTGYNVVSQFEFDLQDGGGKTAGGSQYYGLGLVILCSIYSLRWGP